MFSVSSDVQTWTSWVMKRKMRAWLNSKILRTENSHFLQVSHVIHRRKLQNNKNPKQTFFFFFYITAVLEAEKHHGTHSRPLRYTGQKNSQFWSNSFTTFTCTGHVWIREEFKDCLKVKKKSTNFWTETEIQFSFIYTVQCNSLCQLKSV